MAAAAAAVTVIASAAAVIASAAAQVAIETCSSDDFNDFWASVASESTAAYPAPAAESIDAVVTANWQAQLEAAEAAYGSVTAPSVGFLGSTASEPASVAAADVASKAASAALTSLLPRGNSVKMVRQTVALATVGAIIHWVGYTKPVKPALIRANSIQKTNGKLARRIKDKFSERWKVKVGRPADKDTVLQGEQVLRERREPGEVGVLRGGPISMCQKAADKRATGRTRRRRLNSLEVIFADLLKDLPPRK